MYAQADNQRLLPKPKAMLPGRPGQSAKQPMVKAPPSKILYPSEQAASAGSIGRAHAYNAAHPNTTFFTPHQEAAANRMSMRNNPLGTLGSRAENFLQLKQTAQQLVHGFDPRTKGGIANIASIFAGGPEGNFEGEANAGFEANMPGQFEKYSMARAAADGHLGHDVLPGHISELMRIAREHPDPAMRARALKEVHDHFFGGETHATGAIPKQPSGIVEPPRTTTDAINRLSSLERHRELQSHAFDAAVARARQVGQTNSFLRAHGIAEPQRSGMRPTSGVLDEALQAHLNRANEVNAEGRGLRHPDTLKGIVQRFETIRARGRGSESVRNFREYVRAHNHPN